MALAGMQGLSNTLFALFEEKRHEKFGGLNKKLYLCIRFQASHMVPVVQLVRASDCGSECRGFESHRAPNEANPCKFLTYRDFFVFNTLNFDGTLMEPFMFVPSKLISKSHKDAHKIINFTTLVWSISRRIISKVCSHVLSKTLLVIFLSSSGHTNSYINFNYG